MVHTLEWQTVACPQALAVLSGYPRYQHPT